MNRTKDRWMEDIERAILLLGRNVREYRREHKKMEADLRNAVEELKKAVVATGDKIAELLAQMKDPDTTEAESKAIADDIMVQVNALKSLAGQTPLPPPGPEV